MKWGVAIAMLAGSAPLSAQRADWPTPSGDAGAMRWSSIATVNRANVGQLEVAWRWRTGERAVPAGPNQKPARPGQFQASPVVIGDTLYVSTPYAAVGERLGMGVDGSALES